MPKIRFLKTTHYSTVGGMTAGDVVEVSKEEAERILAKFSDSDVELVETKAKEPAENKAKSPSKNK